MATSPQQPPSGLRIGIDLGGTKIAGIQLDRAGTVVAETRRPAPQGDYSATIEAIATIVAKGQPEYGQRARMAPCCHAVDNPRVAQL